jgi:YD repeat-containing protein
MDHRPCHDDAGKLISVRNESAAGNERTVETYSYDAEGRKQKLTSLIYPPTARTQTIAGASKEAKYPTQRPTGQTGEPD